MIVAILPKGGRVDLTAAIRRTASYITGRPYPE